MIDVEIAAQISSQLIDGEVIEIVLDGVTHERKLLEHVGTYGLCVQGPTNKLTIPVEMTTAYRKAVEMARSPSIPGTPARRPGRPAKTGPQAPVVHPGTPPGGWLPPGSTTGPSLARDVATAEMAFTPPGEQTLPQSKPASAIIPASVEVPVQLAESDGDWIENAVDEMFDDMRLKFNALLNGISAQMGAVSDQNAEVAAQQPKLRQYTCFDCEHVDMDGTGSCGKFKMVPPMNVIVDPKTECPDFSLELPF